MKYTHTSLRAIATASFLAAGAFQAGAAILITEVHPTGSSNASYGADWFEVTNTDLLNSVDITGWTMDDNSNGSAKVPLRGVTSIGPGQSIVFIEANAGGTNDMLKADQFNAAWGTSLTYGVRIGSYGGSGVGLSGTADAVNIFDADSNLVARVDFGLSTLGITFDNAAGLNDVTLTQLSTVGTNGAYTNTIGETGSPGAIPEPSTFALLGLGALAAFRRTRR